MADRMSVSPPGGAETLEAGRRGSYGEGRRERSGRDGCLRNTKLRAGLLVGASSRGPNGEPLFELLASSGVAGQSDEELGQRSSEKRADHVQSRIL